MDLQRDFLEENGRMPVGKNDADPVIASANRLLKHAESAGWLQVFIKNEYRKADWIGNLFRKGAAIEGSIGAEIDPRIPLPTGALVVSKAKPDAFTNLALAEILRGAGIRIPVGVYPIEPECGTAVLSVVLCDRPSAHLSTPGSSPTFPVCDMAQS
jgi:nicotinamidase-related amidase